MSAWFTARVRGHSMIPTLRDGDLLLARRSADVREGALVISTLGGGLVVKRVGEPPREMQPDEVWLVSDNRASSTDSRALGAVKRSAVRGEVVARLWPITRAGRVR